MRVVVVPCLRDNYAYLVVGDDPGAALVVDPSEAAPVEEALSREKLRLAGVLATHHHPDHTGGIAQLVKGRSVPVVASAIDGAKFGGVTREIGDGETFAIGGVTLEARFVPGHTLGAVAFVVRENGAPKAVFTGDTMFVAGCGRLFEGTPADMHRSLNARIATLPDDVLVHCGHEYTEANLRFAAHVEPSNEAVREAIERARTKRANGEATVPSTIGEEKRINPYLRCGEPTVRAFVGATDASSDVDVLARVRAAKDAWGVGAKGGK